MNWKILFGSAVGVTLLLEGGLAAAQEQPWLKDRRYQEGMGYRVGDFEVHPGVAGEAGYDSNVYQRAKDEDVVSAMRLRATGSLSIATLGPQRMQGSEAKPKATFRAGVALTYNEYVALDSKHSDDLSKLRNLGVLANLNLQINPKGKFGANVFANAVRTVEPSNLSDTSATLNRVQAVGGGELVWAPGGGLFDWRVGYNYSGTFFEQRKSLSNGTHNITTRGRWRFLPRTALMFDATQGFKSFPNRGSSDFLQDSQPIRASVGFKGLVSSHFSFLAMAGWGASFYKGGNLPAQNFDSVIAHAEVKYYPTPAPGLSGASPETSLMVSSVALGYVRDFANSYLGSYYSLDRGYLNMSYFFAGRVLVLVQGDASRLGYPTLYFPSGQGGGVRSSPFAAMVYGGSLFTEYRIGDSFGVNATIDYHMNNSKVVNTEPGGTLKDDLSWNRLQAVLGVRWMM